MTSPAIEKLRELGFVLDEPALNAIEEDVYCSVEELSVTDLLLGLGMGNVDADTGEWTPRSSQVYAFDAEIFDIAHMYTQFLHGVQAIVPDIVITDIREDLSVMTDELTVSDDPLRPATDGKRSVSFVCNGHPYSVELDSFGDWFNEDMFRFMNQVLAAENCPLRLHDFTAFCQFAVVIYCSDETAAEIRPLLQPF